MTLTVAFACALASTVLYPLFTGTEWFYAGLGAIIAVAASGALSRLRTLPVLVCLAISVAGLLLYLNLVFEARHSWLLFIPTPGSLSRLWDLAGTGMTDASRYAPPAPELPAPRPARGGRDRHHGRPDRLDRRPAAVRRAGRPAAPGPVHRAHHHERAARERRHRGRVLPGHGRIPGHAERGRPGADPRVGQAGLAVAVRFAVRRLGQARPGAGRRRRVRGDARGRGDEPGAPGHRTRARPGHPGAGRGGPPGGPRVGHPRAVRPAGRTGPAPEQAVLLGPGHRRRRRRYRGRGGPPGHACRRR